MVPLLHAVQVMVLLAGGPFTSRTVVQGVTASRDLAGSLLILWPTIFEEIYIVGVSSGVSSEEVRHKRWVDE